MPESPPAGCAQRCHFWVADGSPTRRKTRDRPQDSRPRPRKGTRTKTRRCVCVGEIERRSPATAPAAAVLRARLLPEQLRQRRRLIKTLEDARSSRGWISCASGSSRSLPSARHLWGRPRGRSRASPRRSPRGRMSKRGWTHAAGVYFPNRAHKVRIAIKKLRYAVEMMDGTESGAEAFGPRPQERAGGAGQRARS